VRQTCGIAHIILGKLEKLDSPAALATISTAVVIATQVRDAGQNDDAPELKAQMAENLGDELLGP
jgi:hypothetical protein